MANDLTKKEANELEERKLGTLATFMAEDDNDSGFEDMDASTRAIPFIKVVNAQTPELDQDNPLYIQGVRQGDIINSVIHKNYGKSINFVVAKFEHIVTEWKPNRGGFVGYHTPIEGEKRAVDKTFGAWKTKEGNDLVDTYMYYMVIEGHETDGVVVFAADSSDLKEARKLNSMLSTRFDANGKRAMGHQQVYRMSTQKATNDKGSWYKPTYEFVDFIQSEFLYHTVKAIREALGAGEAKVDFNQMETGEKASAPDTSEY